MEKNKSLVSPTPMSTAFISTSIVQDFQDSPDDEEDTRSSYENLNDLEEEYQARALLAMSKRFSKKALWQKAEKLTSVDLLYVKWLQVNQVLREFEFQRKSLVSDLKVRKQRKPELRPTKDFEAKYNKVKAKLALLSLSALASKAATIKNKGLIAKAYEWDEEEVSSDDNEMVEVKVLMSLAEENDVVSKGGAKNADDTKVSIHGVERPWLFEAEGFILLNHDTGRILLAELQRNTIDPSVAVTDSSVTDYDSSDESLVCSTPLPPLKKLDGAERIFEPKTIKSILRSKSSFKAETLKGVIINEPSSALAKNNQSSSALKVNSAPAEREINPRNPQHALKRCEVCGSSTHTINDHYDIEWFKRGEALQAKKAEALKLTRAESSNANRSKTLTKSGCSWHMTSVKSNLHKYVEQPGPKVVFEDDNTCTTEGYGSIKCNESSILEDNKLKKPITSHLESPAAIKISKPSVDNINIAENKRYPPDEYLHLYEPSQRYQTNSNNVSFIEPYESHEPFVIETKVSSDQNGQTDQNDQTAQTDEILND
nr:retrovirus-related Pol polyprotein from transposon TNT 1-94 [Tanacetum cinerariifolium]